MEALLKQASSLGRQARKLALELNFYRVHLIFFTITILVSSAIFWASNTDGLHVEYTDALTMCASAMTNCGLNTVNLGAVNAYQQSILFVLMILGDLSVASSSIVYVRRYFFGRKIHELLRHSKAARRLAEDIEEQRHHRQFRETSQDGSSPSSAMEEHSERLNNRRRAPDQTQSHPQPRIPSSKGKSRPSWSQYGYGGIPTPWQSNTFRKLTDSVLGRFNHQPAPHHSYLSFPPELDDRGRFNNLTSGQLEELGGVEYRALRVLTWLLPCYTLCWLCFTWLILLPYTTRPSVANVIRNSQPGSTNPQWWALFTGLSAYSNTGLSLLNSSMIPLRTDYLVLIVTGAAILGGNTFYPICLRATVWTLSKLVPQRSELHHSLEFLLHHPRRCYLFLFPAKNTWYLLVAQILAFLAVWLAFEILNIGFVPLVSDLSDVGLRTMDGLYQAHGVRSSGFYIISQSNLAPACQVFFMINMYLSAIPFIVSLRHTNIYEEQSIGLETNNQDESDERSERASSQGSDTDSTEEKIEKHSRGRGGSPTIQNHIQNQVAYDLWWMVLAVWLIAIIERDPLAASAPGYSLFSIIFEVVSAYGTVGLSLGLPYNDTSFCGAWTKLSKLVLIAVMIRGRHRILPLAVDRAVLIPGQELMEKLDHGQLKQSEDRNAVWKRYEREVRKEEEGAQAEHGGGQDPEGSNRRKDQHSGSDSQE